jgi:hypothetical protein
MRSFFAIFALQQFGESQVEHAVFSNLSVDGTDCEPLNPPKSLRQDCCHS